LLRYNDVSETGAAVSESGAACRESLRLSAAKRFLLA
jgi:hypothetical protein